MDKTKLLELMSKRAGSLSGHFRKGAAHHAKKAEAHKEAAGHHEDMMEACKTAMEHHADGMKEGDDDDAKETHKAAHGFYKSAHAMHKGMAAHHGKLSKAHASYSEQCGKMAEEDGAEKAAISAAQKTAEGDGNVKTYTKDELDAEIATAVTAALEKAKKAAGDAETEAAKAEVAKAEAAKIEAAKVEAAKAAAASSITPESLAKMVSDGIEAAMKKRDAEQVLALPHGFSIVPRPGMEKAAAAGAANTEVTSDDDIGL